MWGILQKPLPKSFPDIEDFYGGVEYLGKGNFGYTFKSILKRVPVVLKVRLFDGYILKTALCALALPSTIKRFV